jgi:hypothetical protein
MQFNVWRFNRTCTILQRSNRHLRVAISFDGINAIHVKDVLSEQHNYFLERHTLDQQRFV